MQTLHFKAATAQRILATITEYCSDAGIPLEVLLPLKEVPADTAVSLSVGADKEGYEILLSREQTGDCLYQARIVDKNGILPHAKGYASRDVSAALLLSSTLLEAYTKYEKPGF